ncbi:chitin deacetylase [Amanita rubescens]|nr:chitin deacetylase [Amanita rubescens]
MKFQISFLLLALQLSVAMADKRSWHARQAHKRQNTLLTSSTSSPLVPAAGTTAMTKPTSTGSAAPPASTPGSSAPAASIPAMSGITSSSVYLSYTPTPAVSGIPQLSQIASGMSSQPTSTVTATYTPGANAPVSGAPPLPSAFVFKVADWPTQDRVPDISSPEVQEWLTELDGFYIPDFSPTADGSCSGDLTAAAQAAERGWWTCGGHTRPTDITACPDKLTWGVSYDDGPACLYTKDLLATFFVVGSRVIERPQVLLEEYMSGHEISVHTWSHTPLTLGWTRKAIKHVLGVTPTTMRPPYGDIDDRVRAISLAMGMVPIIWTSTPSGSDFDTNDWRVGAGQVTGLQSYATFETILANATTLNTGFIVLEHDLFQISVDLAVGYTLPSALNHNPPFNIMPIGQCMKIPTADLYMETTTNKSFPYTNHTYDIDGTGSPSASPLPFLRPTALCLAGLGILLNLL